MAFELHARTWLLVERLYITVYGASGQKPEAFLHFLKRFDIDYPGTPYPSFSSVKGRYTFMSEEDFTFARFMASVPKAKYRPILREIVLDPKIKATQNDGWNYYGERIDKWYPELLQRVRAGGYEVEAQELHPAYEYDVALSFAGENRDYVEKVVSVLDQFNIRVFYDKYEEATLWGKDLYVHLDEVYRFRSKFVVMFVSEHYVKKAWTNLERRSAQARALEEKGEEYILVARLDATEVPGVLPTVGYIDCREKEASQIATLIARKTGHDLEVEQMLNYMKESLPEYEISHQGGIASFTCTSENVHYEFPIRLLLEAYRVGLLDFIFLESSIFVH